MNKQGLETAIRQILAEMLTGQRVLCADLTNLPLSQENRLDTGNPADRVWTRDLFTLEQSPRLGAGLMVMEHTTFPWHLAYDEIDYVISGRLTVISPAGPVTAGPGQVILIPKDSDIQFSAPESARFLYVTYPADWQNQP
ncbi:MAG TPA: ethanolamine utilization protein EutQ [Candidatus Faecousia faecigallinarum]|nr:ethanolamine utilization protein EutQ [Candidatus Faecousia faecigallinarum]